MKRTIPALLILYMLSACAVPGTHVVGRGSSLAQLTSSLTRQIHKAHNIAGQAVQINANNFWESQTRMNMPLSTVLCDALSADLSKLGARITLQEIGTHPLIILGSYHRANQEMAVTLRLRHMGDYAGTDLAVAQGRIAVSDMDPAWLTPEFSRLARTLARLLEDNYTSVTRLSIQSADFMPAGPFQPELVLGPEFGKYMTTALSVSPVFGVSGRSDTRFRLKGEYSCMGKKALFHAVITDQETGRQITGASVGVRTADVPGELLARRCQTIETIATKIGEALIRDYKVSPHTNAGTGMVYVGKQSFHDAGRKAVIPLSAILSDAFTHFFSRHPMFTVTDNPAMPPALLLSGTVLQTGSGLKIGAGLAGIRATGSGRMWETIAFDRETLDLAHCRDDWFKVDLRGKTDYLVQSLEFKSLAHIPLLPGERRPDIVINRFKYQNTMHYSKFSDYLNDYMLDSFSGSWTFTPVKHIEERIAAARTRGLRSIGLEKKSGAAAASLAGAEYYIEGSFWPKTDGSIDIKASLNSTSGQVLASDHVEIRQAQIDPAWLKIDVPAELSSLLTAPTGTESSLAVELFTNKGRNNLSYAKGEEIIFLVKANKNVFVKLYTVDPDRKIYRIYPNAFTRNRGMIPAGEVSYIPDTNYSEDFSFLIQGKTGSEMVFAVASDAPLPDLPESSDTGFYGTRKIHKDINGIKLWFSEYALPRGISLSWDALPVKTY
nr:DUF4384 domain-containing protein [uncultured Desulfobacter sp.]